MYMQKALEQFNEKKTTIAQAYVDVSHHESPVFVVCVEPPFKTSFFSKYGAESTAAERYFWVNPQLQKIFENDSIDALDIYMDMSYQLGLDWSINLLNYEG